MLYVCVSVPRQTIDMFLNMLSTLKKKKKKKKRPGVLLTRKTARVLTEKCRNERMCFVLLVVEHLSCSSSRKSSKRFIVATI